MIIHAHWSECRDWPSDRWPNFSPEELACKGTGRLVIAPNFLDHLQLLRNAFGPLVLNSAYRSPEHNAAVTGGRKWGPHTLSLAIDVKVTSKREGHRLVAAALALDWSGVGIRLPLGEGEGFVHLDRVLPGGHADLPRPWLWSYP